MKTTGNMVKKSALESFLSKFKGKYWLFGIFLIGTALVTPEGRLSKLIFFVLLTGAILVGFFDLLYRVLYGELSRSENILPGGPIPQKYLDTPKPTVKRSFKTPFFSNYKHYLLLMTVLLIIVLYFQFFTELYAGQPGAGGLLFFVPGFALLLAFIWSMYSTMFRYLEENHPLEMGKYIAEFGHLDTWVSNEIVRIKYLIGLNLYDPEFNQLQKGMKMLVILLVFVVIGMVITLYIAN